MGKDCYVLGSHVGSAMVHEDLRGPQQSTCVSRVTGYQWYMV